MKVLILAGGLGTRLSEETNLVPKPMIEIGGYPILWHIMKIYSYYGFNDFIILTGYKGHVIKEYFLNYYMRYSDITIDMENNSFEIHKNRVEPWKVTMLYTGLETMTGSRILHAKDYVGNESFMLTYGDGVCNVDLKALLEFHKSKNAACTMTSILPDGRFGALDIEPSSGKIKSFTEKPKGDSKNINQGWINAGFFVCEPSIFDYIPSSRDDVVFEQEPLRNLALDSKLYTYKHTGFWKCMDTLRDKNELVDMWIHKKAPWALWLKP
ncbi:glucose-1-phosphate cytidylyltransferase [Helicobacter saguini]|uniref:Glucose-1-phosphate cytidylyltransferase n=1 Tax=Helicobacter saguini TaxID=1548018 RepID=A0A347VP40_9HELI|nr:glucose-1-phosphate cytidylyltransferase [Helicobacter saguini]MWV61523.1 glucose-1-phosphate cytidylyltransferase [Helicobacter saguini]MWV67807.1 glucose-1-phosphate cytidylyltransferase [Helicobacter saguini]MWV70725.1 glucose-1-phosphate cytidylyltransferase [Helicobacter saguini]MWV72628.1 glucose-1-phosphate cytidylyltransferase [Helicobacter saguini]TLD94564.1 glucose-1-phosphate cytidylyltransferase [Helicobacter saguini]